jgi:hypothetical protein
MSSLPNRSEWSFAQIRAARPARAAYLEDAPEFGEILSSLAAALTNSLARKEFFFGVDHYEGNRRVTFQFRVTPRLYDTFFNARTGYRAHYWASPECGQCANAKLVQTLWMAISSAVPDQVEARRIEVEQRVVPTYIDTGRVTVSRSLVQASFTHTAGKIWICEKQIYGLEGPLKIVPILEGLPLSVIRWNTHAPLPDSRSTLLDLKGGFVSGAQAKDPLVRAREIHPKGWS